MKYSVEYKDIGVRGYKDTWDYQASVFEKLVSFKMSASKDASSEEARPPGILIFVEHPHVYTLGKSGSENNLLVNSIQLKAKDATFYRTDRGGDVTYHGPGQIVGYPIFDLDTLNIGLKEYIYNLEEAVIRAVAEYGLKASRLEGGTGVWLDPDIRGRARKICAIGVKASRYVTMHGFAFNVNTSLEYFNLINPCGFTDKGVTSLEKELGGKQDFEKAKYIVKRKLEEIFDLEIVNK